MTSAVFVFNTAATFVFGGVHWALKGLGPFWSMVGISWLSGIFMVWVFGKVSNQEAIRLTRNRLSAELIALRLFKDDLRVFFGVQFQVLKWTLRYLRHSLAPMMILMAPTVVILIQLNLHYAVRPLKVGETSLVKVKLRDAAALDQGAEFTLRTPPMLEVETAGVRARDLREISWRVRGVAPGRGELTVSDGASSVTKTAAVGGPLEGVSSLRTGESWLTNLMYPGEPPMPSNSAIESIEILYPPLDIFFFGWRMDWLILFLVLALGFGYACKGLLGVQI